MRSLQRRRRAAVTASAQQDPPRRRPAGRSASGAGSSCLVDCMALCLVTAAGVAPAAKPGCMSFRLACHDLQVWRHVLSTGPEMAACGDLQPGAVLCGAAEYAHARGRHRAAAACFPGRCPRSGRRLQQRHTAAGANSSRFSSRGAAGSCGAGAGATQPGGAAAGGTARRAAGGRTSETCNNEG